MDQSNHSQVNKHSETVPIAIQERKKDYPQDSSLSPWCPSVVFSPFTFAIRGSNNSSFVVSIINNLCPINKNKNQRLEINLQACLSPQSSSPSLHLDITLSPFSPVFPVRIDDKKYKRLIQIKQRIPTDFKTVFLHSFDHFRRVEKHF